MQAVLGLGLGGFALRTSHHSWDWGLIKKCGFFYFPFTVCCCIPKIISCAKLHWLQLTTENCSFVSGHHFSLLHVCILHQQFPQPLTVSAVTSCLSAARLKRGVQLKISTSVRTAKNIWDTLISFGEIILADIHYLFKLNILWFRFVAVLRFAAFLH